MAGNIIDLPASMHAHIARNLELEDIVRFRAASHRTRFDPAELLQHGDSLAYEGLKNRGEWLQIARIARAEREYTPINVDADRFTLDPVELELQDRVRHMVQAHTWNDVHQFVRMCPENSFRSIAFSELARAADTAGRAELLARPRTYPGVLLSLLHSATKDEELRIAAHPSNGNFGLWKSVKKLTADAADEPIRDAVRANPGAGPLALRALAKIAGSADEHRAIEARLHEHADYEPFIDEA